MRARGRLDANHGEIVKYLRSIGCSVQSLAGIGKGCPDLLVSRSGVNFVFEVKDPDKPPSAQKLTEDEQKWWDNWTGAGGVIHYGSEAENFIAGWLKRRAK